MNTTADKTSDKPGDQPITRPAAFAPCVVIPFYEHEARLQQVLDAVATLQIPCFLVNDGSRSAPALLLLSRLQQERQLRPWLHILHLAENGGKGEAVLHGLRSAAAAGCTHALQVDADAQHDLTRMAPFLAYAAAHPQDLINGTPVYDSSVPRSRLYGRYATHLWVWIETLSLDISDSMCGFRVYPLAATLATDSATRLGRRMDFDIEIIVRLHWVGIRVRELPIAVRYYQDGRSHFHYLRDNLRISALHTRLAFGMLWRLPFLLARRWRRPS